jgi:ribosomal protection tetracycline resistance protein
VCEPIVRVRIETPADTVGAVLAAVGRLGGVLEPPSLLGDLSTIETVIPAARATDLQRQLPELTGGEGVLDSDFCGYQPVTGAPSSRPRTTANPLNRQEYMMHLARRTSSSTS